MGMDMYVAMLLSDQPLITYSCVKSFHNTTTVPILLNKYKYAVVVRKGRLDLLAKINQTIDRLDAAGALSKLDEAWLGDVRRDRDLEVAILKTTNP
jgi:ABC-type amino acid transport substrate-binding protein